jgi:peptidoglycan/LPS O-acetylase OafA/YrhL
MLSADRRYDIDWLRVIAIGLLLIYHVAIGFQRWGIMIGFIASEKTWESLWIPMALLNVWRIPLLFFVSGMGVYFAIRRRNWKELLRERGGRILIPFLFGMFVIVPIHLYIWRAYYQMNLTYTYSPGHLWFLGNIFIYVLVLSPVFFYLKENEEGKIVSVIKNILSNPLGLLLVMAAFIAEALIVNPRPYEMYAMTWHGFFLGLLAFFFGFCFVLSGRAFWDMITKWRWLFLSAAVILFVLRITQYQQFTTPYLLVVESDCWIISVLAFGCRHLNHPGKTLNYLSQAAYPVYIVHMIFLYLGSMLIFPLDIEAPFQFVLVLMFTVAGCFAMFELIRRTSIIRPLFGLKMKQD